ncbi:hypothetical protein RN09_3108 [Mycobacterium tuberculosis variant africanum]|nr:hypothetical protein RN09_3108 [Mycobacterium tuberculosis variant africanum]
MTVPKAVRDALGLQSGDRVVFRVEGNRPVLARTPDFLAPAGTIRWPSFDRSVDRLKTIEGLSRRRSDPGGAADREPRAVLSAA